MAAPDPVEISVLWSMHCANVPNVKPDDPVVREVASAFDDVVSAVSLVAPQPPLKRYGFTLRMASLPPDALSLLCHEPAFVMPLIEFTRARAHFEQSSEVLSCCLRLDHRDALPPTPYDQFGTSMLNRVVVVCGTVVRLSSPKPVCTAMSYACTSCGEVIERPVDGPLVYPVRCEAKSGKGRNFTPLTDQAKCQERQTVKLQEAPALHDDRAAAGGGSGIARMIDVELCEDLIDTCAAGDVVHVVGTLATKAVEGKQPKGAQAAHQLVVKAAGVQAAKQALRGLVLHRGSLAMPVFAEADIARFRAAAASPGWFDTLAGSFCPGIIGHAGTKAAMLLSLVGGTPRSHTRSNIHVAIFGDPGLGKSQLLRAACAVSPRGVYVSANSSSSCGLTVSLSRDSSSATTFEAGAVVHGDGGVTCIDEIDKGAAEHKALLEVMEQESLSVAKAGMIFSLPVRTTVMAAGNPVGGRFQPGRSITENLNLSAALLSRFDFVFVLVMVVFL